MNISQPLNPQPKRSPSRVLGLFLACVVALFAAVPEAQAQACDIATDGANSGFGASLESCTESIEGGNNVQAITIPTPAGINPGDLLIVSINIDDAPAMNLPPTDWQEVAIVQAGGGAATLAVYSKFVVGGEDASYTFGWSGGNQEAVGIMLHFSGVTGNYQFATDSGTGTPGTPLGPGVDTNGNSNPLNNLILRLVTYDDDDLADGQNPLVDANHSRINFDSSGGGGASVQGGAAYQFQGVAGDTGGVTFPDGDEQWATMSIALEPRPSPACTVPSVGSGVYVVYESCEEAKDTGVTSISLNTPAGVAANDLLIAVVSVDEDVSTTIAAPFGWDALTETVSSGEVTLGVYAKVAGAVEVGPYDFTWTGAQDVVSYMLHFSNVDTGTPPPYVVSSPATATGGVGEEAPVAPVVTTISPNNLILRIAAWDGAGQTPDPATIIIGHSNINQDESANAAGAVSSGAAYEQQPSTGPSATASFQTVNEEWVALSIAIEP